MRHKTEQELIAYREGWAEDPSAVQSHLAGCAECRLELDRIEAVLAALDTLPVPDPGQDFGRRVWQQIAPRLAEKPRRWFEPWTDPKRLAALGTLAAVIVLAFYFGRITKPAPGADVKLTQEKVRQRVLVLATRAHLGRSERMLVELSNAEPPGPDQKQVNISSEQHRAEELLEENRLYRQTAVGEGETQLASILDELERVLLDLAHSPDEVTPAQLEGIRQKIRARGILFKVRVVGTELQQRERNQRSAPRQENSLNQERNKV